MKKQKLQKKIPYIDYACNVGERVQWDTIDGKHYEGIVVKWGEYTIATIKLDNGTEMEVQC